MKKFILRIVACFAMAAMISTCFGTVGTALADDVAHTGELTVAGNESWWGQHDTTMTEVLGDVALEDVTYIRFYADAGFVLGYNNGAVDWFQTDKVTEYKMEDLNKDPYKWTLAIIANETVGTEITVKWEVYTAGAAVEEPVAEEPKAEEPVAEAPASGDLVITFAGLGHTGYGYVATDNGDAVDVTISGQYQEIQYALPEVVDLAAYTTLIVDVTSSAQLDIKLVNPEAVLNEYSQLTPFLDFYTAEGAITAPITIDLAAYADKDLSQINFMAMVGDTTTLTIKSITFVGAAKQDVEEPKTEEPVEEPKTEEPVEEPKTEEPVETPETTDGETKDGREVLAGETIYVVKKGDCLWAIAKKFLGKGSQYTELFERNKDIIKDATLIFPSQEIIIPAK